MSVISDPHSRMPDMPSFEDFYKAVNDRLPFPWQARLARDVYERGEWPAEIGVPTGLGKTACLDIAVWWLASQAHLPAEQRSAPTRIWWVVNRRLLVDEASMHAAHIAAMLRDPDSAHRAAVNAEVVGRVATRLSSLTNPIAGDPLPLFVAPMRGGIALRRPPNPAQPSVIVSTIPMYGSRLLFRGYGSSRSMRPIDAALAGTDSLVLVDEAHLARHLKDLIPKLQQCGPAPERNLLPARRDAPQVVSLTATGGTSDGDRFNLDDEDHADPIIRRRLDAAKPVQIDADSKGDPAKALLAAAESLLSAAPSPASCVVFCNTPSLAREVFALLKSHRLLGDADLTLVTGRTRQLDSDALRRRLLSPAGARAREGVLPERDRYLVVVATQTLEVGADLDFEYLVTEQCGVRALTQRLGRLNRLGHHQHARAVYVHRPPRRPSSRAARAEAGNNHSPDHWPVYGKEPEVVLERLENRGFEEQTNLSPRVIAERLGKPLDDPGRAPEVLPGLLWEWIKTTTPPQGEAPVEPYFSGIKETQRTVSVLWRIFLPALEQIREDPSGNDTAEPSADPSTRHRLWPRVHQDEVVEVPIGELRAALRDRGIEYVHRITDGNAVETVDLRDLRPGDLAGLPTDAGMCDEFGWDRDSTDPVSDLSLKRWGLPLNHQALARLCGHAHGELNAELRSTLNDALGDDEDEPDDPRALEASERLVSMLRDIDMAGFERDERDDFIDALNPTPVRPRNEVPRLEVHDPRQPTFFDEADEVSRCDELPRKEMELVAHGTAVGDQAKRLAASLGLTGEMTGVIGQAGDLHDLGKADSRFQRWLNPDARSSVEDPDYVLMAKSSMAQSRWSTARSDASWPAGGRHEELSARLVKEWIAEGGDGLGAADRDLLVHLVVSHHGRGRPLVVPVADGTAVPVRWTFADGIAVSVSADLSETDWDQPARFRRLNERYGPWSLALLEALVRQADHEVSATTEVQ